MGISKEITTEQILEGVRSHEFEINGNFKGKDILSIEQFKPSDIFLVMQTAQTFERLFTEKKRHEFCRLLEGKRIMVNFAQESTRTYSSFISAGLELGAMVVGIPQALQSSSFAKGETIEDTMKTYEAQFYSAVVLRHPQNDSTLKAAHSVNIPIISGGSGTLEHPTQALLDLYTVLKESKKSPDQLHLALIGDLKNGRTIHSLAKLMVEMGCSKFTAISPEILRLPTNLRVFLESKGAQVYESDDILDAARHADILYMTRVQKEHMKENGGVSHIELANSYKLTPEIVDLTEEEAVIMHPLPRNEEIPTEIDSNPKAAYFRQVGNGIFVRMALLYLVLGKY